jgi:hypothetical protein
VETATEIDTQPLETRKPPDKCRDEKDACDALEPESMPTEQLMAESARTLWTQREDGAFVVNRF